MLKFIGIMVGLVMLILLSCQVYGADREVQSLKFKDVINSLTEVEVEYLLPIDEDRQIDTISVNILKEISQKDRLSFYQGITITRVWGSTFYKCKTCDNSAFGLGPDFLLRYDMFKSEKLALSMDMNGGLIFYNQDFPAGGKLYNFMWRLGPKLSCIINDQARLNVGYKLMHVSNGSISGKRNPAYDAGGLSISLEWTF